MWCVRGELTGNDGGSIKVTWNGFETEDDAHRMAGEAEGLMREAFDRWFPNEDVESTTVFTERWEPSVDPSEPGAPGNDDRRFDELVERHEAGDPLV